MNRRIARYRFRALMRHPRRAVRLVLLASSLFATVRVGEARAWAGRLQTTARRAVSDAGVPAEAGRARRHASRSARRAQRLGVQRALTDKRVARDLRHVALHASRAASLAVRPRRTHRIRKAAIVVAGTGVIAGIVWGKRRSSSSQTVLPTDARTEDPQADDGRSVDGSIGPATVEAAGGGSQG